jgi:hypothetical protein
MYQNIMKLRNSLQLQELVAKEANEPYQKVLDESNALKAEWGPILDIVNHKSPAAE